MIKSYKETKEEKLHKIPLRITDTTLRDAHQSLWATRMRTTDILKIIDAIDSVGYYSLEVWGGATFDVCLRFLRENPWERLKLIKEKAVKTPLQMLLRGQNLVGYRNYSDDVVDRFVANACRLGIDIFRVFDALNDSRNIEAAVKAVKKYGGHAQGTLCYTISPVHTVEKYVQYAKEQVQIGIDSLCIKDIAGILSPIAAERLVSALIKEIDIPIQLHCHATSGMATATYVEGVRAGAGAIDCAVSSMAGFSSQPPVETLVAIFSETKYHAELDLEALEKVAQYFQDLAPLRNTEKAITSPSYIDPQILIHQIPGGMISTFRTQLKQQNALDKLNEVLKEVAQVRQDLGYPPLVTPTSQLIGTQAVLNVLAGERYKIVPNELKDYLKGLYGRPPSQVNKELLRKILGDEKPITHRPADDLQPMLPKATENVDPTLIENEEDIISYVLYPQQALEYFSWRKLPPEKRPPIPADIQTKHQKEEPALEKHQTQLSEIQKPTPISELFSPSDYKRLTELVEKMAELKLAEMTVKKGNFSITFKAGESFSQASVIAERSEAAIASASEHYTNTQMSNSSDTISIPQPQSLQQQPPTQTTVKTYAKTINAPIAGTFYTTSGPGKPKLVNVGDLVNAGTSVCMVEAMKLFNEIKAPCTCKIVAILVKDGETVVKDQPLIGIEEV